MKAILWLITLLWFAGSWYYYTCKIKQICPSSSGTTTDTYIEEKTNKNDNSADFPILFAWSNGGPDTTNFASLRDSLLRAIQPGENLIITGFFHPLENNSTSFKNLGLARANAIRSLFTPDLDESRVQIEGIEKNSTAIHQNGPFVASNLTLALPASDVVKSIDNKAVIYFPTASNQMIQNSEILDYLQEVAYYLKDHPSFSVHLVGHTDDSGASEMNMRLGLNRANRIKVALTSIGVNTDQITVTSKGESQPIANNSTEEGKRKNRRVELEIIEQN